MKQNCGIWMEEDAFCLNRNACFESYFEGVDKSSVWQRLKGNAVLQRRINQEESDLNGKPICGVGKIFSMFKTLEKIEINETNRCSLELP